MNLYQKLAKVMSDVGTVEKTGHNAFHKYAFIEQGVLMAKLRPLLAEAGIVILPEITSVQYRKEGTVAQCAMAFTLVNADNPEDRIGPLAWAAEGEDKGDKAVNKAGTSGHKYFLLKLLLVSDKDDPDAESAEEQHKATVRVSEAARTQTKVANGTENGQPHQSAPQPQQHQTVVHTASGGLQAQGSAVAAKQSHPRGPDGKALGELAGADGGSKHLGERARAFMAEIGAAESYEDINGAQGIAVRVRAAQKAGHLGPAESAALFDAINRRNQALRTGPHAG